MKKRLLVLLLAVLTLLALASCKEETTNGDHSTQNNEDDKVTEIVIGGRAPTPSNFGTFYIDENGYRRNDLFTLELVTQGLSAPVTALTYKIHNASTCTQSRVNTFEELKKKENGEWVSAPGNKGSTRSIPEIDDYNYHSTFTRTIELGEKKDYFALAPGE